MKKLIAALLVVGFASVVNAETPANTTVTGEFGNHCAYGLTSGMQVKTDCSINWKSPSNKTYCFSTEEAKASWAKDAAANEAKATAEFGKISGTPAHG